MSKKIYLSPSNQYDNQYAYGNTSEMKVCNTFAKAAEIALKRCGFTVKRAPEGQAMSKSISESNSWGADLHIPIHTNAGGGNGTLVMVYSQSSQNMALAKPIYNAVQAVTPGKIDYGIREYPQLAELNSTNAIAVYIEVDFHDNKEIAKWLINNSTTVGEAIAKGVCSGYGVKYVAPNSQNSSKPTSSSKTIYRVQVGAFSDKKNAENYLSKIKKAGFSDAFITEVKK